MEPFKDVNYLRGKRLSRAPGQKVNQDEVRGNEHYQRANRRRSDANQPENLNLHTRMFQGNLPGTSSATQQRRRITLEPDLSIFHNHSHLTPGLFRNSKVAFDHQKQKDKIKAIRKQKARIPEVTFSNVKNGLVDHGGGEQFRHPGAPAKVSTPSYSGNDAMLRESFDKPRTPTLNSRMHKTAAQTARIFNDQPRPKTIIEHYVPSGDSLNNGPSTSDFTDDFDMQLDLVSSESDKEPSLPVFAKPTAICSTPFTSRSYRTTASTSRNNDVNLRSTLEKCPLSPISQANRSHFVEDIPYTPDKYISDLKALSSVCYRTNNDGIFLNAFSTTLDTTNIFGNTQATPEQSPEPIDLDERIYDIPRELLTNNSSSTNISFNFDFDTTQGLDVDLNFSSSSN